jgi:hypothetical protein
MKIKRLQQFMSRTTGQVVKVTKVIRPDATTTRKKDLCMVKDVIDGVIVDKTARMILSDSLRRKYIPV